MAAAAEALDSSSPLAAAAAACSSAARCEKTLTYSTHAAKILFEEEEEEEEGHENKSVRQYSYSVGVPVAVSFRAACRVATVGGHSDWISRQALSGLGTNKYSIPFEQDLVFLGLDHPGGILEGPMVQLPSHETSADAGRHEL